MKKLLVIVVALGWILISANPALSAVDLSGLNRLENVTVSERDGQIDAIFTFASEFNGKFTPAFYEKSIQIDVPGAYTSPAKREFGLKSGPVTGGMAAQINGDTVRTRLFLKGDSRDYSSGWKVKKEGSSMILTLDVKAPAIATPVKESAPLAKDVPAPTATEPAPVATVKSPSPFEKDAVDFLVKMEKPADRPVAETMALTTSSASEKTQADDTEKKSDVVGRTFSFLSKPAHAAGALEPSSDKPQAKKLIAYDEPKAPEAPSMKMMALKMAGALALVVSLVFALAWVGQKYMGKLNNAFGNANVVKVLSTSSIGVKKQISVVDVAGELIVLGISGDNITMLTTIENSESADRLRRMSGGSESGPLPRGVADYMKASGGSSKGDSFLRKVATTLGKKNDKGFSEMPPALLDEDNPLTFAGAMKTAASEPVKAAFSRPSGGRVETRDMAPSSTKDELLRKVTGAIRAKNGSLGLA